MLLVTITPVTRSGKAHIYRQNYSLIAGINPTNTTVRGSGVNESEKLDDTYILIKGQTTQILPTAGKFKLLRYCKRWCKSGQIGVLC